MKKIEFKINFNFDLTDEFLFFIFLYIYFSDHLIII